VSVNNQHTAKYNKQIKEIKPSTKNENRIPNVASISEKKASKMLQGATTNTLIKKNKNMVSVGNYSYLTTKTKDSKTLDK
jgi:hypothetical protein